MNETNYIISNMGTLSSSLRQASSTGNFDSVRQLLTTDGIKGIDVNAKDDFGNTYLHYASYYGKYDIVNFLITIEGIDINVKNSAGDTPLHYASGYGHPEIVKVLIFSGAEVNIKNNYGKTPLDIALENQRYEIVEILKKALEDQHPIKEPDV